MENNHLIKNHPQLISVLWLRRAIGLSGLVFPLILFLGTRIFENCPTQQFSISDYYHSNMRDMYVGFLCIIAVFLFIYKGYSKADNIASNLTSFFALCSAFFPTSIKNINQSCFVCKVKTYNMLHNIFASLFFLLLVYFCLFLFPKTEENQKPTFQKIIRNKIYFWCGIIMLINITFTGIFMLFGKYFENLKDLPLIFIFEWIALSAFGFSWITKGEMLFADSI